MFLLMAGAAFAGEADIKLPDLTQVSFYGRRLGGMMILNVGLIVCLIGMIFGVMQYVQTKNLPAHKAMLDVSQTIWETCKTYLFQQGKFLIALVDSDRHLYRLLFWRFAGKSRIRHHYHSGLLDRGYSGFLHCGLVRYPYQYRGQFPRRLCFTERRSPKHRQHLSAFRHERWTSAGQHRTVLHDHHSGLHSQRIGRSLLHRFCHR